MAKYNKEALLADYHTGLYSQRDLAKKYQISVSTVSGATKGLKKKTEQLVQKKVEVTQEIAGLTEQEANAVEHSVQFKLNILRDIELFSNSAMQKANELVNNSDTGADFNSVVTGVDRLSILTKINHRHAPPTQIQQNTQNNGAKETTRVFHVVE